jgi:hypothetical protein
MTFLFPHGYLGLKGRSASSPKTQVGDDIPPDLQANRPGHARAGLKAAIDAAVRLDGGCSSSPRLLPTSKRHFGIAGLRQITAEPPGRPSTLRFTTRTLSEVATIEAGAQYLNAQSCDNARS